MKLKRSTAYAQSLLKRGCCDCGESRYYLVEIHHIDGDPFNNKPDNVEIVCSNCHRKRHLKKDSKGRWVYHPKNSVLTPRHLLSRL